MGAAGAAAVISTFEERAHVLTALLLCGWFSSKLITLSNCRTAQPHLSSLSPIKSHLNPTNL